MRFTHNGQEYETVGYSERLPRKALFIGVDGDLTESAVEFTHAPLLEVRPVRKEHVFGGVRFRETGGVVTENTRDVWILEDEGAAWLWVLGYGDGYPILEPVEVVNG